MTLLDGRRRGFSLVELVVVIVIIGVLAAIAIPRLSRGASGAGESSLKANLQTLRGAITMYAAEHGNAFPGPDATGFEDKLTKFSNRAGDTVDARDKDHLLGPYVIAIPPCPVGENAGKTTAADVLISATSPPTPDPTGGEGWVYNANTGQILPNTTMKDEAEKAFNEY